MDIFFCGVGDLLIILFADVASGVFGCKQEVVSISIDAVRSVRCFDVLGFLVIEAPVAFFILLEAINADTAVFTERDAHIENPGENVFVFFHDFRVKLQVVIGVFSCSYVGGIQLKFRKHLVVCGNRCDRAGVLDIYEIERAFDIEFHRFGNGERVRFLVVCQIVAADFESQAVGTCVIVCDKAQKVFAEVEIKTCVDIHCAVIFFVYSRRGNRVFTVSDFKVGDCKFDTESPVFRTCGQIKVKEEFAHLADAAVCARFFFKAQLDCAVFRHGNAFAKAERIERDRCGQFLRQVVFDGRVTFVRFLELTVLPGVPGRFAEQVACKRCAF